MSKEITYFAIVQLAKAGGGITFGVKRDDWDHNALASFKETVDDQGIVLALGEMDEFIASLKKAVRHEKKKAGWKT